MMFEFQFIPLTLLLVLLLPEYVLSEAPRDWSINDDSDLWSFVSRPDLKPPKFNIITKKDGVTPGYWFTGPYDRLGAPMPDTNRYEPCQVGPHIYDNDGELVWSGACMVGNRVPSDYRAQVFDGRVFHTVILADDPRAPPEDKGRGVAWIMDETYALKHRYYWSPPGKPDQYDMHEFKMIDGGKSALTTALFREDVDLSGFEGKQGPGPVIDNGFREIDVETGRIKFEWKALDHLQVTDSKLTPNEDAMDWIHLNSVDKDANGDYLISGRFTSTIYKISGEDGHVIWRLEGTPGTTASSFQLDNFNFSFQHDARFFASSPASGAKTQITFLNNAAFDTFSESSTYSSGLLVELDTSAWTATVLQSWDRPDHDLSRQRGNIQHLDNGHVFCGWSQQGYISEFDDSGNTILEAKFASSRFYSYRTFKSNFTGRPTEAPAVKAFVYGTHADNAVTVAHVSWNGATQVGSWNFYGVVVGDVPSNLTLVGNAPKRGFETSFTISGNFSHILAEPLSKVNGQALGRNSSLQQTVVFETWDSKPPATNGTATAEQAAFSSTDMAQSKVAGLIDQLQWWLFVFMLLVILHTSIGVFGLLYWCKCRSRLHAPTGLGSALEKRRASKNEIGAEMKLAQDDDDRLELEGLLSSRNSSEDETGQTKQKQK